jgi:hypothetical protein
MTFLSPGANAALPPGDLTVLIRHGTITGAEIDVSAFLVTGTGKVRSDADMCFYGQPSVAGGGGHARWHRRRRDPIHGRPGPCPGRDRKDRFHGHDP